MKYYMLIFCGIAATACYKLSPYYCEGANAEGDCPDGGSLACQSSADCSEPTPVCHAMTCSAGCATHADCVASSVCLPDGACADEATVAYVDPGGTDNESCTQALPCTKPSKALATGRPYVKLTGTTDEGGPITIDNRDVVFLAAPGAKLVRTSDGPLVEIKGTSQVEIYDLEISGASGAQGIGIYMPAGNAAHLTLSHATVSRNAGGGIVAMGGALTVTRSRVNGNAGGGIAVTNGTFAIVGNLFITNGVQNGSVGGVAISTTWDAVNRLEFNSFFDNRAAFLMAGGAIECTAGTFAARNNILSYNGFRPTSPPTFNQVGGSCAHAYSITVPYGPLPGPGNLVQDPMFVDIDDFHLMPGSPALGSADPESSLTGVAERDLDGDRRIAPADIGADEVP